MNFASLHVVLSTVWMLFIESKPWPTLTLIVSPEAIFLPTFVMIGQNRQTESQQADHDFTPQELELKTNTELTREIHRLTTELHRRLIDHRTGPEKRRSRRSDVLPAPMAFEVRRTPDRPDLCMVIRQPRKSHGRA
jgi:uncharacterized membrane protein